MWNLREPGSARKPANQCQARGKTQNTAELLYSTVPYALYQTWLLCTASHQKEVSRNTRCPTKLQHATRAAAEW